MLDIPVVVDPARTPTTRSLRPEVHGIPYACSIRFLAVTFMVRDSVAVLTGGVALSPFEGLTVAPSNEGSGPVACRICQSSWPTAKAAHTAPSHHAFWLDLAPFSPVLIAQPRVGRIRSVIGRSSPHSGRTRGRLKTHVCGNFTTSSGTKAVKLLKIPFHGNSCQCRMVTFPTSLLRPTDDTCASRSNLRVSDRIVIEQELR